MSLRLILLALLAGLSGPAGAQADSSPLATAPTEFMRAQAANGVHWQAWNDATLARAQASGRSVYVFIGSPLSELSRATITQTFSSEKTVAWLNENFFCIFVDADAQPGVAAYAQHYLNSVKQLRGWPAHLWLTPDKLLPYDGANYLPPSEEWGKAGYLQAARRALDAWTVDPARARALAVEAVAMMRPTPSGSAAPAGLQARLDRAAAAWIAAIDSKHGGFGTAPKNPEPELIRFLLSRGDAARAAALNAARALISGAVRDPVDGGFNRRTIDEAWQEPYHQKMLADQARIALALLDAADAAKDDKLRGAAHGALDFALKELRKPDGSFAAALDGTLEENTDPTKRPRFVRVGTATIAAQGLLVAALQRSGEKRFMAEASTLAKRLQQELFRPVGVKGINGATAADYAAMALALRTLGEIKMAGMLLDEAGQRYFDAALGAYMAAPADLPPGIAVRVPASGDTPSAEALVLLAGVDQKTAGLLRRNLLSQIEYDEQPPGDVLLALAARQP